MYIVLVHYYMHDHLIRMDLLHPFLYFPFLSRALISLFFPALSWMQDLHTDVVTAIFNIYRDQIFIYWLQSRRCNLSHCITMCTRSEIWITLYFLSWAGSRLFYHAACMTLDFVWWYLIIFMHRGPGDWGTRTGRGEAGGPNFLFLVTRVAGHNILSTFVEGKTVPGHCVATPGKKTGDSRQQKHH
jgi:hypothetical protein